MDKQRDDYKFLVCGDSISRGVIYHADKKKYSFLEDCYANLLQNRLKGVVTNAARFGNTILKGVSRLPSDIFRTKPDVVVLEFGGNDCDFNWNEIAENPWGEHHPKTEYTTFKMTLEHTVQFLKNNGIIPVLFTLPPINADKYFEWITGNKPAMVKNILQWLGSVTKIYWWQERYNSAIIQIAEQTRTLWIDIRGAFLQQPDYTRYLCLDGIHPNEEGHRLIARTIEDYIHANYGFLLKENMGANPPLESVVNINQL